MVLPKKPWHFAILTFVARLGEFAARGESRISTAVTSGDPVMENGRGDTDVDQRARDHSFSQKKSLRVSESVTKTLNLALVNWSLTVTGAGSCP